MSTTITAGNATNNGASIASDTAGTIEIKTGSTPTTAITVDGSQNVGIGTASPSTYGKLAVQVSTPTSGGASSIFGFTDATKTGALYQTGSAYSYAGVGANTLWLYGNGSYGAITIGSDGGVPITFVNNSVERMRIDTSNTLTSNATSNRYSYFKLSIAGTVGVNTYTDNVANAYFVIAGGSNGVFLANGGTSWTSNSDERLKDIIEPITDAVDKVSSLRSVIGKYKTDEKGTRRAFLIAQDVEKVLPEAVTKTASIQDDDNEYLGVQYTDVIPLLVAAIKEQQTMIEELKTKVAALEAK